MHKSHQTRITSYSNQLNQQHAEQIEQLRKDYEQKLSDLQKEIPNDNVQSTLQEEKVLLENKLKVVNNILLSLFSYILYI